MPFGYSRKIFKFPAVQYIPLDRYNEKIGQTDIRNGAARVYVYTYKENNDLNRRISFLNQAENYSIPRGQLAVFIKNARVNLVQYRGYEVTMVGREIPGTYQLFTVTTQYFYKDRIIFILYNGETSERLDIAHVQERIKDL
ncbi:MAG: hypothetical protein GX175_09255 [Halanaerobiaceae bacterium]|nr:hypothetical protein [Halanaerobiaceae bacterium]